MTVATSLTPPSPGLSATLLSKNCEFYSLKGPENVNITTLYRCTGILLGPPHGTTTEVVISKLSDKGVLWKYSIQTLGFISLFMRDNGRCAA